ncbi:hypothetical protein GCM10009548_04220 [Streptomyces malaysiensis subsp. malaysiensis]|uniref:FxLD family lanthipeptide n=1 Tax=Streptomyces malaysiensis TaxID=92644 RepID=A0ABX6W3T8_STRMQ|nr:FxLD family lanthipeptide [Streptomyces solisilvae]
MCPGRTRRRLDRGDVSDSTSGGLVEDEFELDITVLESGDRSAKLINLTDDGCGSTCSSPCASSVA